MGRTAAGEPVGGAGNLYPAAAAPPAVGQAAGTAVGGKDAAAGQRAGSHPDVSARTAAAAFANTRIPIGGNKAAQVQRSRDI